MKTQLSSYFTIWILISLLALTSCSKDSDDDDGPSNSPFGSIGNSGGNNNNNNNGSRTQMLTGKTWSPVTVSINPPADVNGDGTTESDLTPLYQQCNLDDIYDFKTDQSYTGDEGPTKCDPNSPQVFEQGTWNWAANETQIVLTTGGQNATLNIDSFSATQLVASQATQINNNNHTLTITYQ
jgi:hypothetical protein